MTRARTEPQPAPTAVLAAGPEMLEIERLTRRLRMPHLRAVAHDIVTTAKAQRWDPAEVVRVLLDEEARGRDHATTEYRRRKAGFPSGKTFDTFDPARFSIPRPAQHALATLEWIERRENLVVAGPSGTGKSHFCEALGHAAINAGLTVAWFTIEQLGTLVARHRVDDSITKALKPVLRCDLVIVDDIGLLPVADDAAESLYRLIDAAYERRSVAISSNLHPSGFDELMPRTIATALVDRLMHHAHILVTTGDSVRLTEAAEPPWVRWRLGLLVSYPGWGGVLGSVERCFELCGRDVAAVAVEAVFVEPVHPRQRGELDVIESSPRAFRVDELPLVEPVERLGHRVDAPIGQDTGARSRVADCRRR